MDLTSQESTFKESVKQVMQTLPPVIKNYLAQSKYTSVAKDMMTKYSLHIDQGGILEREIMLLLMGIENPGEFVQALAEEAHIDQKTIDGITQDVNDKIFVPLREAERNAPVAPKPASAAAAPPRTSVPVPKPPVPQAAAAANESEHFHLENKLPNHPSAPAGSSAPLPPKIVMPGSGGLPSANPALRNVLTDVTKPTITAGQTSPAPRALLEDHEEPHLEIHSEDIDKTSVPPNLPGAMPQVTPELRRPVPPPAASHQVPPAPPALSYATDPYREPIDDK